MGYGKWKALPAAQAAQGNRPGERSTTMSRTRSRSCTASRHRGEAPDSGVEKSRQFDGASSQPAAPDDPDRPKLHKKPDDSGSQYDRQQRARRRIPTAPSSRRSLRPQKSPLPIPTSRALQKARPQLAQDIGNVESVDVARSRPAHIEARESPAEAGTLLLPIADGPANGHAAGRCRLRRQEPPRSCLDLLLGQSG